ncbi:MAG: hypothetical protein H0X38_07345 [Planctomycetes bacterium]|nr:hypothetical protein [Planctomycetota bacterium]
MRYTISAVTEHQEGIENIRSSLLRHGIDLRTVAIGGRHSAARIPVGANGILVSVVTDDPAEVELIKAALAAAEGSDIRVEEAIVAQSQTRWS